MPIVIIIITLITIRTNVEVAQNKHTIDNDIYNTDNNTILITIRIQV
jgi:hypothetical protein